VINKSTDPQGVCGEGKRTVLVFSHCINIFIDPLKTQKHHISGLQHTFTHSHTTHTHKCMHKQRHANIHTHAQKKDKAPVVQTTMFTEGQIRASPRQQQQIESPPTALA